MSGSFAVRVNSDQRLKLEKKARLAGYSCLSEYVRAVLLNEEYFDVKSRVKSLESGYKELLNLVKQGKYKP